MANDKPIYKKGVEMKKPRKREYNSKWTEEKALQLADNIDAWVEEDDLNLFINEYIYKFTNYTPDVISDLANKFESFGIRINGIRSKTEAMLLKGALTKKYNYQIVQFILKNKYEWTDKSESIVTTTNEYRLTIPGLAEGTPINTISINPQSKQIEPPKEPDNDITTFLD